MVKNVQNDSFTRLAASSRQMANPRWKIWALQRDSQQHRGFSPRRLPGIDAYKPDTDHYRYCNIYLLASCAFKVEKKKKTRTTTWTKTHSLRRHYTTREEFGANISICLHKYITVYMEYDRVRSTILRTKQKERRTADYRIPRWKWRPPEPAPSTLGRSRRSVDKIWIWYHDPRHRWYSTGHDHLG